MAFPVFSTIILGVFYLEAVEEELHEQRAGSQINTTFFNFGTTVALV